MNSVMLEEYKVLRQELEMNRKFVFERPLLIVGATLAGALSPRVGLLPIPFLGVLLFNLWFTFNRLWSSARIVAYIQLVHEGTNELDWIGWENALRKFRSTAFRLDQASGRGGKSKETPDSYDPMGYYGPLFYFHFIFGVGLTILSLLLSTWPPIGTDPMAAATALPIWLHRANIVALVLFGGAVIPFRPAKVRYGIERQREVWKAALDPAAKASPADVTQ